MSKVQQHFKKMLDPTSPGKKSAKIALLVLSIHRSPNTHQDVENLDAGLGDIDAAAGFPLYMKAAKWCKIFIFKQEAKNTPSPCGWMAHVPQNGLISIRLEFSSWAYVDDVSVIWNPLHTPKSVSIAMSLVIEISQFANAVEVIHVSLFDPRYLLSTANNKNAAAPRATTGPFPSFLGCNGAVKTFTV